MTRGLGHRSWRWQAKESSKAALRAMLLKVDLGLVRDPYISSLARALDASGVKHVLDVGANVGQYAKQLRAAGYEGHITSFEPLHDAYTRLVQVASKDVGWAAHNHAVGDVPGAATLHVSRNLYSSSLLSMTQAHLDVAPDSEVVDEVTVDVVTVDNVVESLGIDSRRAFLKVDTQGFEGQVLAGAAKVLPLLAGVQLELSFVELYSGQELFDELRGRMADYGLFLFNIEPGIRSRSGQMLQCDGVFMRPGPYMQGGRGMPEWASGDVKP